MFDTFLNGVEGASSTNERADVDLSSSKSEWGDDMWERKRLFVSANLATLTRGSFQLYYLAVCSSPGILSRKVTAASKTSSRKPSMSFWNHIKLSAENSGCRQRISGPGNDRDDRNFSINSSHTFT